LDNTATGTRPTVLVEQTQFINNTPVGVNVCSGIFVVNATVHIKSCLFSSNKAADAGSFCGAVCADGAAQLTIQNSSFDHNVAQEGAAMKLHSQAQVRVEGRRFSSNLAKRGGAIFARGQATLECLQVWEGQETQQMIVCLHAVVKRTVGQQS
jgi:predicted outer membrane repeat protein